LHHQTPADRSQVNTLVQASATDPLRLVGSVAHDHDAERGGAGGRPSNFWLSSVGVSFKGLAHDKSDQAAQRDRT
jgi:hypothetical protein